MSNYGVALTINIIDQPLSVEGIKTTQAYHVTDIIVV